MEFLFFPLTLFIMLVLSLTILIIVYWRVYDLKRDIEELRLEIRLGDGPRRVK